MSEGLSELQTYSRIQKLAVQRTCKDAKPLIHPPEVVLQSPFAKLTLEGVYLLCGLQALGGYDLNIIFGDEMG